MQIDFSFSIGFRADVPLNINSFALETTATQLYLCDIVSYARKNGRSNADTKSSKFIADNDDLMAILKDLQSSSRRKNNSLYINHINRNEWLIFRSLPFDSKIHWKKRHNGESNEQTASFTNKHFFGGLEREPANGRPERDE